MAHNTVVVDGKDMAYSGRSQSGGSLELFATVGDTLQVMEARQENAYPGISEYARQPWFIGFANGAPQEGYVIDLFRVSGGSRHEYTLQGDANRDAQFVTNVPLTEYGPYLLPPGTEVTLPEDEYGGGSAGGEYYGYIYVRDVKMASLPGGDRFTVDLKTKEGAADKAGMRITGLLGDGDHQLFLGSSPSIRNTRVYKKETNDMADQYVMPKLVLRREGSNLSSVFTTVLEPYAAGSAPRIDSITALPIDRGSDGAVAIAVKYGTTTDIIISSPHDDGTPLQAGDMTLHGKMGFIRLENDSIVQMHLIDGTRLSKGNTQVHSDGSIAGKISSVQRKADGYAEDAFVIQGAVPSEAAGQYMIVTHPDQTTHGYKIKSIQTVNGTSYVKTDGIDPGFVIQENGKSRLLFYPGTVWNGDHTYRIVPIASKPLTLNGAPAELVEGQNGQLQVVAYEASGARDVTAAASYSSSNPNVLRVLPDGSLEALAEGTALVTARYGEAIADAQVTVLSRLASIELHPADITMVKDDTIPLTVFARYRDQTVTDVTYGSSYTLENGTLGAVSANGQLTAIEAGTTVVTATYGGKTATSRLLVLDYTEAIVKDFIDRYAAGGELGAPMSRQLLNSLEQASHHYAGGRKEQAIKHLGDFLKHLGNGGLQQSVSDAAKLRLEKAANGLIRSWSR